MTVSIRTEAGRLADQLERSFHGGAWHGPAVRETVAGVDAATALQRPHSSPHSILALVRHMSFWLNAAHVRIANGQDVSPDNDWPADEGATDADWTKAVEELERAHAKLHATVLTLGDDHLDDTVPGTDPTIRGLLLGTLQHNAYHTGQIVQLARENRA